MHSSAKSKTDTAGELFARARLRRTARDAGIVRIDAGAKAVALTPVPGSSVTDGAQIDAKGRLLFKFFGRTPADAVAAALETLDTLKA